MTKRKKLTHEQMDAQNWRYKKQTPPVDEFADRNGPVKLVKPVQVPPATAKKPVVYQPDPIVTALPHPFQCSRCSYVASSAADSRHHWLEHD